MKNSKRNSMNQVSTGSQKPQIERIDQNPNNSNTFKPKIYQNQFSSNNSSRSILIKPYPCSGKFDSLLTENIKNYRAKYSTSLVKDSCIPFLQKNKTSIYKTSFDSWTNGGSNPELESPVQILPTKKPSNFVDYCKNDMVKKFKDMTLTFTQNNTTTNSTKLIKKNKKITGESFVPFLTKNRTSSRLNITNKYFGEKA